MLTDDDGHGLVEYGLILALAAVVCIGATPSLGTTLSRTIGAVSGNLP